MGHAMENGVFPSGKNQFEWIKDSQVVVRG